jgi:hypothetical protein
MIAPHGHERREFKKTGRSHQEIRRGNRRFLTLPVPLFLFLSDS